MLEDIFLIDLITYDSFIKIHSAKVLTMYTKPLLFPSQSTRSAAEKSDNGPILLTRTGPVFNGFLNQTTTEPEVSLEPDFSGSQ